MKKEEWREMLNQTSEGIYTTVYYTLYRKGIITKEEYKKLADFNQPMRQFADYMDMLTKTLK